MEVSGTREFHRLTEHAPHATAPGGPFDPRIEPAKTKRYRGQDPEPLPPRWQEPAVAAAEVLSGACPATSLEPDRQSVARLLFLSQGVTRVLRRGGTARHFRAAPSAGALYPVEAYLVCRDLPGLPAGVYHHEPEQHGLHRLREGDHRGVLARAADDGALAATPFALVLTGILWRTSWKYGPRGYRHLYWDAGTVLANTLAAAASAGWPARVLTGFVDHPVGRLLDLDDHLPFAEWPLALAPVGEPGDPEAPETDEPEPLRLTVEPLSSRQVEQPSAHRAHASTELTGPEAVGAWRAALRDVASSDAASARLTPPEAEHRTIEEVVLQRGSTRAFAREPIPVPWADWGVDVGLREVPGDLAAEGSTALEAYLAVHAVEGREPGGYRWRPSARWERVADEQPRRLTAGLCLGQDLGGTAALTAFLCADLSSLLEAAGPRAYRVAQLAAGIAAGRLQLAAFTLGIGGTGLTFYDDEVRRHFGTSADPMLVTALGRPAYEARRGRRPPS